jgi:hypothetical protein
MGQFSCKGWDCKNSETKQENEFRTSLSGVQDINLKYQGIKSNFLYYPSKSNIFFLPNAESHLITLQSNIRGYLSRINYQKQLKQNRPHYYYFSIEECECFLNKSSTLPSFREETSNKMYPHGGIYSGEMRGGFRDGLGKMKWKDGASYEGCWSFGRPAGQGIFIFPDGEKFKGHFGYYFSKGNENNLKGLGVVLWQENVSDGFLWLWYKKAICINSPRSISMTPRNEEVLAKVQEKYILMRANFEKIAGDSRFPKDAKERRYPDGGVYKGDMQGVKRHGFGKSTWPEGDFYEGEWKDDAQSGWGKNCWKEGAVYVGFFLNGLKDGLGKYVWEDGTEFFGEWKANKMDGVGRYTWNDGKLYLGQWVDGTMQGFGVLMWKDGRKYEGNWMQGKKHGEGLTFYSNGRVSRDIWRYGKIIKPDV